LGSFRLRPTSVIDNLKTPGSEWRKSTAQQTFCQHRVQREEFQSGPPTIGTANTHEGEGKASTKRISCQKWDERAQLQSLGAVNAAHQQQSKGGK
jgi:hypothetical protein